MGVFICMHWKKIVGVKVIGYETVGKNNMSHSQIVMRERRTVSRRN